MHEPASMEELYPLMADAIARGETVRLYPQGTSMEPMLYAGRDSVLLGAADTFAIGDVLLYRRKNGAYVLHRLIEKRKEGLMMCGDHQTSPEHGVAESQVLAKVVGYYVGDEYRSLDSAEYQSYVQERLHRFPFYRRDPKLYAFLRKVKHAIVKRS